MCSVHLSNAKLLLSGHKRGGCGFSLGEDSRVDAVTSILGRSTERMPTCRGREVGGGASVPVNGPALTPPYAHLECFPQAATARGDGQK